MFEKLSWPPEYHCEYDLDKNIHVIERRDKIDGRLILRLESAKKISDKAIQKIFKVHHPEFNGVHELSRGGDKNSGFYIELEEVYEGEAEWNPLVPRNETTYFQYLSGGLTKKEYKEIRKKEIEDYRKVHPLQPVKFIKISI